MSDQIKEKILINGKKRYMYNIPDIPTHQRIREIGSDKYSHTGCWREYVGTWKIKDDKLYLVKIDGKFKLSGALIFANWVNETIIIPEGEVLASHYQMYKSIYEQELHIVVTGGVVTKSMTIDSFDNERYAKILENKDITRKNVYKQKENLERTLKESRVNHAQINFIFISLLVTLAVMFTILFFR